MQIFIFSLVAWQWVSIHFGIISVWGLGVKYQLNLEVTVLVLTDKKNFAISVYQFGLGLLYCFICYGKFNSRYSIISSPVPVWPNA